MAKIFVLFLLYFSLVHLVFFVQETVTKKARYDSFYIYTCI